MKRISLFSDVQFLRGVGPKYLPLIKKLLKKDSQKIRVYDLLHHFPRDYSKRKLIKDLRPGEKSFIYARIIQCDERQTSKGPVFTVDISDGTGNVQCAFFNYSEIAKKRFRWGRLVKIEGEPQMFGKDLQFVNPIVEFNPEDKKQKLLPVYPLTEGLRLEHLRFIMENAMNTIEEVEETLSPKIREKYNLIEKKVALKNIHFPEDEIMLQKAIYRLKFEELFFLELAVAQKYRKYKKIGIQFGKGSKLSRQFYERLKKENPDFELTRSQKKVLWEIFQDMERPEAMNRLLQGDVGSGKTIVASFCILKAIENGYQVAFMAPTEILAEQHFILLKDYFEELGVKIALLIGSTPKNEKEKIYKELKEGEIDLVIGTHALLFEKVEFKNLGFVVIDEQHKFGVLQRARLREKGTAPDLLVMTATPIPRSLSLTLYGELDISTIEELPPGRKPVKTYIISEENIEGVYNFVKKELDKGHQCYIVYPAVEETQDELKTAKGEYRKLKEIFKDYKVGLLYGKMTGYEKTKVMRDFREGKIQVLCATTVIEIGLDAPKATCIVIQHAERFGLAQLHQLRGRVGRSELQSYCFLVVSKNKVKDKAAERLKVLLRENNGFKIAQKDLEIRGPGEFLGIRQHGFLRLKIADIVKDFGILKRAREAAFNLIKEDPLLCKEENRCIRKEFERLINEGEISLDFEIS